MRFIVVADTPQQRMALSDTLQKLDFCDTLESLDVERVMGDLTPTLGVVWLVDVVNYYPHLLDRIDEFSPSQVILGFEPAPSMTQGAKYERWQRGVIRKIARILQIDLQHLRSSKEVPSWRYVVFLGASMGGIEAVKEFLDRLPSTLPVAILLAQHYNENMLDGLPKIITRHNEWRCRVIKNTQSLQSGLCLIAPIDKQVTCDSTGRIILSQKPWDNGYRPNIGTLLKNSSEVFGNQMIGIILSGMGNDGSQHAGELTENQSRLWAQDPATCQSPSQPQSFIDTKVCQFVGSPTELAEQVQKLVDEHHHAAQSIEY